jgi:hypothetical protein
MTGFPKPTRLLQRIAQSEDDPVAVVLCPDFAVGSWRYKLLAEHLFDWLPDAALRTDERRALLYEPNKQLAQSCRRMFDTADPSKRGEVGEILLHAICRQEFHTTPFVARLFYKMRSNDSITSIDVVHVVFNDRISGVELWLGEAKLYDNMQEARYAALKSIRPLWDPEFLTEMKALIGPKIDSGAPYLEELSWLFQEETTLDQIIRRIVIPICLAADYPATTAAIQRDDSYLEQVAAEMNAARAYFAQRIPAQVNFVVILVPMDSKLKLENAVNARIQSYLA